MTNTEQLINRLNIDPDYIEWCASKDNDELKKIMSFGLALAFLLESGNVSESQFIISDWTVDQYESYSTLPLEAKEIGDATTFSKGVINSISRTLLDFLHKNS